MAEKQITKYLPQVLGSEIMIREMVYRRARVLYDAEMLDKVGERIEKELEYIKNVNMTSIFVIIKELLDRSELSAFDISISGDAAILMISYLMGISNYNPIDIAPLCILENSKNLTIRLKVPSSMYNNVLEQMKTIESIGKIVRIMNFKGGLLLIPKGYRVEEYLKIQKDDKGEYVDSSEYLAHPDIFYKIDIIANDDLQLLNNLKNITGISIGNIDVNDIDIIRLFNSSETLGYNFQTISNGLLGVRDFMELCKLNMTENVRIMDFDGVSRLKGLILGGNTYYGNAKELIKQNITDIYGVISTKEDFFDYLIKFGVPQNQVLNICKSIELGKGLDVEDEKILVSYGVPEYYIESCKKIKYLHSKSLIISDTLLGIILLYFKMYRSEAFYKEYINVYGSDQLKEILSSKCYGKFLIYKAEIENKYMVNKDFYDEYYNNLVIEEMFKRNYVIVKYERHEEDGSEIVSYYTLEEFIVYREILSRDKVFVMYDQLCVYLRILESKLNILCNQEFENIISKISKIREAIWCVK